MRARHGSVLSALYLLFNEGYHGSAARNPLHPAMCADALRLAELLLESPTTSHPEVHALAALFCFNAARLPTRLDDDGVFVPLAEQALAVGSVLDRAPLADIERRAGRHTEARRLYGRAIELASSEAERLGYERKLRLLEN